MSSTSSSFTPSTSSIDSLITPYREDNLKKCQLTSLVFVNNVSLQFLQSSNVSILRPNLLSVCTKKIVSFSSICNSPRYSLCPFFSLSVHLLFSSCTFSALFLLSRSPLSTKNAHNNSSLLLLYASFLHEPHPS